MADSEKSHKELILRHMNADHQKSLSYYLRVYCDISWRAAQSAVLEDVRLTDMLITAQGVRYTIPFDPPMKSLTETRVRVVAMHKECLQRLGISDIIVKEYRAPRGAQAVVFGVCLATYVGFSRRSNFVPGSLIHDTLGLQRYPGFTAFAYKYQAPILLILGGLHLLESLVLMAGVRLRKHGVPFLSGLWFTWVLSNFIEGFGALQRFDGIVKEKKREQESHTKAT